MRTAQVSQVVIGALAPYIGDTMARAAVQAQLQKLGLGATLRGADVEALLGRIAAGLNVFVGPATSAGAVEEARKALAALEEAA